MSNAPHGRCKECNMPVDYQGWCRFCLGYMGKPVADVPEREREWHDAQARKGKTG